MKRKHMTFVPDNVTLCKRAWKRAFGYPIEKAKSHTGGWQLGWLMGYASGKRAGRRSVQPNGNQGSER